jgi:hypothetical protein
MILINEEELFKHRTDVHLKEKHQCQSYNQIFESKDDDFERHAIRIHGGQLNASFDRIYRQEELSV